MTEEIQPRPPVDPEAFQEAARKAGETVNEMHRQALTSLMPAITAVMETVKQVAAFFDEQLPGWQRWADEVPGYSLMEPSRGCHCLCAVAHNGIGGCAGIVEPDLYVTKTLGGEPIEIPVCRACFEAGTLVTS